MNSPECASIRMTYQSAVRRWLPGGPLDTICELGKLTTQHRRGFAGEGFVRTTSARTVWTTLPPGPCFNAVCSAWARETWGPSQGNGLSITIPDWESRSAETFRSDGPIAGCNTRTAAKTRIPASAIPVSTTTALRIACTTAGPHESSHGCRRLGASPWRTLIEHLNLAGVPTVCRRRSAPKHASRRVALLNGH